MELFRKVAVSKTVGYANDKLLPLICIQFTVFQTAAHHCPASSVPHPLAICDDEGDALCYREWVF
jgi:hypothetical protein